MKLKLFNPVIFKNINGEEEQTDYIFLKKPTIGDLTKKQNIGILASIMHEAQRAGTLGMKALSDGNKNIETNNTDNTEDSNEEEKNNDEDILDFSNSIIVACVMGGYNNIEEDLLKKGPAYFDRFLFVDENMSQNISSNLIKDKIKERRKIMELNKIIFGFFIQASKPSQTRKIEM